MSDMNFTDRDFINSTYIPEGEHVVTVTKIEDHTNQNTNKHSKKVIVTDAHGRTEKEFIPLGDNAKWRAASFALACGIPREELVRNGLTFSKLIGRKTTMIKSLKGKRTITVDGNKKEVNDYEITFIPLKGEHNSALSTSSEDDIPF